MSDAAAGRRDGRGHDRLARRRDERPRDPQGRLARPRRREPGRGRRDVRRGRPPRRRAAARRAARDPDAADGRGAAAARRPARRARRRRTPSSSSRCTTAASRTTRSCSRPSSTANKLRLGEPRRPGRPRRGQPVFRETLELLLGLRAEIEIVGSVASGAEAIEACAQLDPDVVVVDYRMPGLNGAQTTAALLAASPATRVVCLTASISQEEVELVLAAGAVACLTKDESLDRIVEAIRERRRRGALARREPDGRQHGDRARLDRRLPGGARALPELARRPALRQLRRDELPRLRRPRAGRVLRAARRRRRSCRRPRSRRRATSSPSTRSSLPRYERILSLQLSSTLSGTFASAEAAAASARRRGARDRHANGLGGDRDARARGAAAARARHDRRGDRRARRALPRARTGCSSRSTRSSTSPAAAGSAGPRRSPGRC